MKGRLIRSLAFVAALSLSALAVSASDRVYQGCWSPYPNCVGASDIYQDSQGRYWDCGACGTLNPNSQYCREVGSSIEFIGYWCPERPPEES